MANLTYYSTNPESSNTQIQTVYEYEGYDRDGVICIAVTGLVSLAAVSYLFIVKTPKPSIYRRTHLFGYLISLFVANTLQSIGTVMSMRWVLRHEVIAGTFCSLQGAIKQLGNVGTAVWSLILSIHLFNLLFMRSASTRVVFWATIVLGWSIIGIVVVLGPAALQTGNKGPYFGISGPWCWITNGYPKEQIFLEYFFEFLSAGLSMILYIVVILRVRGNLVRTEEGKWRLQFVPSWDSWKLAIGRDLIDTSMLKFASNMVWFPIFYTIILIPITITRLSSFAGNIVTFAAIVFADVVFNMTGIVNVTLLISTRRFYPDMKEVPLPEFTTQRTRVKQSGSDPAMETGITPFTLVRSNSAETYEREQSLRGHSAHRIARTGSGAASMNSQNWDAELKAERGSNTDLARQHSMNNVSSFSSTPGLLPKEEC
ncbi:hypothetical protein D9757_003834 [Collybiopsis confluens]|uniref:Glucose receptor Git3 N-terminal domain-containing protein n=1 Tax=Collybiopsis confluens TaxID=2823264 RepID=A0A8H5MDQ6_9AGAR|nr:hypothetical protein D9757_003834 [Collybiopsis confluens]